MTGVVLCIISVVPMLVAGALGASDKVCIIFTAVLLVFVAIGVYILVWAGIIQGCYNKILQLEDYSAENKRLNENLSWFAGAYWCIITAVYLGNQLSDSQMGLFLDYLACSRRLLCRRMADFENEGEEDFIIYFEWNYTGLSIDWYAPFRQISTIIKTCLLRKGHIS